MIETPKAPSSWIVTLWMIWAHSMGTAIIALGISFGIIQIFARNEEVMIASDVKDIPKIVHKGEKLSFYIDLERRESCPGEVVTIYSTVGPETPAVITLRKPSTYTGVKTYNDVHVITDLPERLTPGRWRIASSLVSSCPNRTWTDFLYTFEFEVVM